MITKPISAYALEIDNPQMVSNLKWPLLGSPKLDGIRCLKINGKVLSKTFKEIPNLYIQSKLLQLPDGLDGELIVSGSFNNVQSAVMTELGEPDFKYYVFDYVIDSLGMPYITRLAHLNELQLPDFCVNIEQELILSETELYAYEAKCLQAGYEGIMLRDARGRYKCGKSTLNECYLLKVKRFNDSECIIIGFEEQLHNNNEATKDNLGHTKRSSHKSNKVPNNTLGKFIVREIGDTPWKGREFRIGTGEDLNIALRKKVWDNQSEYLGKFITYKYQAHGSKDLPRIPIYKGFRSELDIS